MNMKILRICLLAVLIFLLITATHKYGPYTGKVVDAETGNPIEGAAVHLSFYIGVIGIVDGHSEYAGAVECLTDKNGEFKLSRRVLRKQFFSFWDENPEVIIFKPGYGVYPNHQGSSIDPKPEHKWSRIDENRYCVVRLPKLKSLKERKRNLLNLDYGIRPQQDTIIIKRLESEERVALGFSP